MSEELTPAADSAARAFDLLRGEVSLLRRGIEALTAERQAQLDYTPTLTDIDRRLEEVRAWARKIDQRPGIRLSPTEIASEIEAAAALTREAHERHVAAVSNALAQATAALKRFEGRILTARDQRKWLLSSALTAFVFGSFFGAWLS
jgi:hypothetical protein